MFRMCMKKGPHTDICGALYQPHSVLIKLSGESLELVTTDEEQEVETALVKPWSPRMP